MRTRRRAVIVVMVAALIAAGAASAHHSFAMYDATRPLVLRGRVTAFRWVSPHATFSLATDITPGAAPELWVIELSSPANMARLGWTHSTVAIGDHLVVYVSPMRDGTHGGACRQVRFLDKDQMLECGAGTAIHAAEKPQ
jgi:hypothetical protein